MPKLKILSGFEIITQKGSHVKIRRFNENNKQTLIIPNHKQLDTGTLRGILKQASKYIPLDELKNYFFVNKI